MKTTILVIGVGLSALFAYLQYKTIKENLEKVSNDVDEVKGKLYNIIG